MEAALLKEKIRASEFKASVQTTVMDPQSQVSITVSRWIETWH